jgi:hypothetical protein
MEIEKIGSFVLSFIMGTVSLCLMDTSISDQEVYFVEETSQAVEQYDQISVEYWE